MKKHISSGPLLLAKILKMILSILTTLLVFRFVFYLFGANQVNVFVNLIYEITYPFIAVFSGIFPQTTVNDLGAVFEPASLLAIIVVQLLLWIIMRVLLIKQNTNIEVYK